MLSLPARRPIAGMVVWHSRAGQTFLSSQSFPSKEHCSGRQPFRFSWFMYSYPVCRFYPTE